MGRRGAQSAAQFMAGCRPPQSETEARLRKSIARSNLAIGSNARLRWKLGYSHVCMPLFASAVDLKTLDLP